MPWNPPSLTLKWGPYTKPDPEEQLNTVRTVQEALAGTPLITLRLGVEKLRQGGVFDIDNVDAVIEELEAKAGEQAAKDEAAAARDLEHEATKITAKSQAAPPKVEMVPL